VLFCQIPLLLIGPVFRGKVNYEKSNLKPGTVSGRLDTVVPETIHWMGMVVRTSYSACQELKISVTVDRGIMIRP